MKVLIVDDTPLNLRLLRAVLVSASFEVVEAKDGVEALQLLRNEPVDAVISDILMPNMDGYRFCHEVRKDPALSHLPFIVYSSTYNSPADEKLAIEMGSDKFIKKPAPVHQITAALEEIMSRGPRRKMGPLREHEELSLAKLYNETLVNKLEQKNQELFAQAEALRDSEEKFRQLAENVTEVCWIATAAMPPEILYISPSYEKVYGRTCESIYTNPMSILDGIPHKDHPRVLAQFALLQAGGGYDIEHQVVHLDGKVRWVHARASVVRDSTGKIYRLAGICEDITARKSTEDQLRQAQKMEAIGQLAGGVAHDFNNLLMVIGANVELMLMTNEALASESKEYLNDIANAAARAATLTRQLLSFSRSEAMNIQVIDLNKLVATFTKLLSRVLGESIVVVNDLSSELPPVKADPGMVEQIIMNLAVNARDAMPAGGQLLIRTEIQTVDSEVVRQKPQARAGRFACISVSDIGTGIAPEHMARIFEPFFTTKGVGKGTGLGLATVFGIAEQHQGWVDVISQVGVGTTFRVFLPITEEKVKDIDTATARKTVGKGERILIAEDDFSLRRAIAEMLQRNGYAVFEADSGVAARQMWTQEHGHFDLLLTDMIMTGGVTGLELADMLRVENPDLKVIVTSGYSKELLSTESASAKRLMFLNKPFSPQKLVDTVRHCLDGQCHP